MPRTGPKHQQQSQSSQNRTHPGRSDVAGTLNQAEATQTQASKEAQGNQHIQLTAGVLHAGGQAQHQLAGHT